MFSTTKENDAGDGTGGDVSHSELSCTDLQTSYSRQHGFRGVSTVALEDRIEGRGSGSLIRGIREWEMDEIWGMFERNVFLIMILICTRRL